MLQRLLLCAALSCALFSLRGSAQSPPAECVEIFNVDQTRPDFIIVPEVTNCFSCSLSNPSWLVESGGATVPVPTTTPLTVGTSPAGTTTVVARNGFLVLPMPELYVLTGISGRRDIFCNDNGGTENEARLTSPILTPPGFDDITVLEGAELILNCRNTVPTSIGRLQILNPNGMEVGTTKYQVQNISRTNAGTYSCIVSSALPNNTNSLTVTAEVIIEYPPEVTPINSTAITHRISLGSELRLSCGYVGVPEVSTQWIQNTTLPLTNGTGGVSIVGGDPGDTEFSIVISPVRRDSGGLYTCNANNTRGSDMAMYSVLILIPPAPVTNLMVTNVGEREVSLSWMTGFDGFTRITDVVVDITPQRGTGQRTGVSIGLDGMETITGLMPFRSHTFSVAVVNMVGLSNRRMVTASTLSLRLAVPENIMFVAESSTNIRLTWQPPVFDPDTTDEPLFYIIEFMRGDGQESMTRNVTANERMINFQNLMKGTTYQATITAHNVVGPGNMSLLQVQQTDVDPPSMPQNVVVEGAGATVLRVTWTDPADNGGRPVTRYRIIILTDPLFSMEVVVGPNVPLMLLVLDAGLTENTTYTVLVSAMNERGFGMNATELGRTQSIEEPQTLFVMPTADEATITNRTAVVMWEFPGGTVDTYLVQYVLSRIGFATGVTSGSIRNITVNGNETTAVISNLLPGSTYLFRVASINSLGMSAFSMQGEGRFQTLSPDPPVIVSTLPNPVLEGTTITLTCTSALEGATFSWTLGADPVTQGVSANGDAVEITVTSDVGSTYTCTARSPDNGVMVSANYEIVVQPRTTEAPTIDTTVIIIVATVGGVALLTFIVVLVIAICCLCVMRNKKGQYETSLKMSKVKKVKTKERPNANWIETSTQYVPATGNQSAADTGTAADRLAFDYSVDLQTHSSFNTMEKQRIQATTGPAQPVDTHAPIAPGPEYEVGSPAFQYVPSEPPAVVNGNEAGTGGEHPGYVNLNATVV